MRSEVNKEPKLYITVTPEFYEKFRFWAKRLGLTLNNLGGMCLQAGIGSVIRAVAPEEALTPDQFAAIMEAAEGRGLFVTGKGRKDATGKVETPGGGGTS